LHFHRPLLIATLLAASFGAAAQAPVKDAVPAGVNERLERLERLLESRGLLDLLDQIQSLEREVQRLRGELETQGHALEQLRQRQRDLYTDVDRRMQRLEGVTPPAEIADPDAGSPPLETLAPVAAGPDDLAAERSDTPLTVELVRDQPRQTTPAGSPAAAPGPVETPPAEVPVAGAAAQPSDPARARADYERAFTLLKQARYDDAIRAFRQFLAAHPGGENADNAQYWLAEAYYVTRDFEQAIVEYERLAAAWPESQKLTHALLKIGFSHQELGRIDEARRTLENLRENHPGTTAARLADERLKTLGTAAGPARP
jgi:tol-pal system protein YbgF